MPREIAPIPWSLVSGERLSPNVNPATVISNIINHTNQYCHIAFGPGVAISRELHLGRYLPPGRD